MVIKNWKTREMLFSTHSKSLRRISLRGLNLDFADLQSKKLIDVDICGTRLRRAKMASCLLENVNLDGADLRGADLRKARFADSSLISTDLSRTILAEAQFLRTDFSYAKMYRATIGHTTINECATLHKALRIDRVRHFGPSSIDLYTLRKCSSGLPDSFLEGLGYTKEEVWGLRTMYGNVEQRYLSCFISHARSDGKFVDRLVKDLRENNVSCWRDIDDLLGGIEWEKQVNNAIEEHDKLVLVCSRRSLYRPNVVKEILKAMDEERATGKQKLFPIRLDDHIISESMVEEAREKVRSGEWRENWVFYVSKYHIPDFSQWESENTYRMKFDRLLLSIVNPADRPSI